ncbi:phosphatase PAP2 family protein [Glaciimonas sp. Gout2]|uniref:acid phosphatase n=1 Tax=unclassified Glaciimonas TaxID=2644401 RepID=UPI002AB46554|nr:MULTISPECIES: phosphatase PAP2 family protein [unclassified Glaciimonas]MDY7544791.1 phosphatase PAP2 family protein [Glaciimonas sp. CA11.2]MEB0011911.1 phosphatase PAP2 family protein [Glaciimonas sp. Cout2]MEB0082854.1 phosphatase PAP2 family protein [Glaciimonas sp. Gout2]
MRNLYTSLAFCLFAASSFIGSPAIAKGAEPFISARDIDLVKLLPPPPPNDSAQTKAELGEILTVQVTRTPEMVARAKADAVENIWRFADVLGPNFKPENLPKFSDFFSRVVSSEGAVVDPSKNFWQRPRPYQYSDLVKPVVKLTASGSYPSGHATGGTLMGIVLANMVPEKRAEIMARAREYANNRIVGGVHYPSDIEAGRIVGTLIAANLMMRDDFKTGFASAKIELRNQLGLAEDLSKDNK